MLEFLNEGQVYEVLLVTSSNVAPIGVVRKGKMLFFKLFGGKSAEELRNHPYAAIQITNDAELLVKLALNLEVTLEFEKHGNYRWIRGLPGIYGRVKAREEKHEDELGKARVLRCSLEPKGFIAGSLSPRALSRADFHLIEMAVHFTRFLVAVRKGKLDVANRLYREVMLNYRMYKRFGGNSEVAERMIETAEVSFGQNSTDWPWKENL